MVCGSTLMRNSTLAKLSKVAQDPPFPSGEGQGRGEEAGCSRSFIHSEMATSLMRDESCLIEQAAGSEASLERPVP